MKYLKQFESFEIDSKESLYLHKKSLEYLSKLSDTEKLNLKNELEKFASDHGVKLEDLRDRELVENLLSQNKNEGVMSWLKSNWGGLMRLISKYGTILSIVTFALGLGAFYATGVDTMPVIKASAAAFIISNAAGALSGLG